MKGVVRVIRVTGCRKCPYSSLYWTHGHCKRIKSYSLARPGERGRLSFEMDDKIIEPPEWCPLVLMPYWLEPFPAAKELNEAEEPIVIRK